MTRNKQTSGLGVTRLLWGAGVAVHWMAELGQKLTSARIRFGRRRNEITVCVLASYLLFTDSTGEVRCAGPN